MARAGEGWSIGVTWEKESRAAVMANASFSRRLIRGTPSSLFLGTESYRPLRTIPSTAFAPDHAFAWETDDAGATL